MMTPEMGERDLHVWTGGLDLPPSRLAQLELTLAPNERERIDRLRSGSDRRRATASRGLLRYILAGYTGRPADELQFVYGPAGKPGLSESLVGESLHFNVTHSGDLLLVVVGRVASLGIDVERVRPIAHWERVARRAFSRIETEKILALPPEKRAAAFVACWTRKEACVKAVGEGVWTAFNRFEVTVTPDEPAEVISVDDVPESAADWSLYHLEPATGFVGALAVLGTPEWRLWTGTLHSLEAES